jgi:hypothetical protein
MFINIKHHIYFILQKKFNIFNFLFQVPQETKPMSFTFLHLALEISEPADLEFRVQEWVQLYLAEVGKLWSHLKSGDSDGTTCKGLLET